jgi:hypothetical protein
LLTEKPLATIVDQSVLDALENQAFSLIQDLAQLTDIPITTVHQHLTQSLGFLARHFRRVSHNMRTAQKAERVSLSNESFTQLRSIEYHAWQFIITLDGSWFWLATSQEHI